MYLTVRDGAGKRSMLKLGDDYRINPATFPVGDIELLLGPGSVKFAGASNGVGRGGR